MVCADLLILVPSSLKWCLNLSRGLCVCIFVSMQHFCQLNKIYYSNIWLKLVYRCEYMFFSPLQINPKFFFLLSLWRTAGITSGVPVNLKGSLQNNAVFSDRCYFAMSLLHWQKSQTAVVISNYRYCFWSHH